MQTKIHNRNNTTRSLGPCASRDDLVLMRIYFLSHGRSWKCMRFWGHFLSCTQYICFWHYLFFSTMPQNCFFVCKFDGSTDFFWIWSSFYVEGVSTSLSKTVSSYFVVLWIIVLYIYILLVLNCIYPISAYPRGFSFFCWWAWWLL